MEREELPDGVRLREGDSSLSVTRPARGVELIRAEGYGRAWFADVILEQREAILEECGTIALFDDLERVRGYESEVRTKLTGWSRAHRAQIAAFHILTGSKIVSMGVALANIALGQHIVAHSKRTLFEVALRQAVAGATR